MDGYDLHGHLCSFLAGGLRTRWPWERRCRRGAGEDVDEQARRMAEEHGVDL